MSTIKPHGGPAFHVHGLDQDEIFNGMTLRDYFAAKAMQGIAANNKWNVTNQIDNCVSEAYAIADAMLAERAK